MLCVATSTFIIYSYYSSNHDHYDIDGRLASLFYALEKIKVISCLKGDELT